MRPALRNALMLLCASMAFQAPFITLDAFASDEGIVLVAANDLANGRLLYQDINVPLSPAVYMLQAFVFKIFGSSFLVSRFLIALSNAIGVVLIFALAHCFLSLRRATLAGALAIPLQIWMWPHSHYFSYNTLAMLLAMLSIRVAWSIEAGSQRQRNAFCLGAVFAAGLWTKLNIPLAVGAGVLVYWLSGWLRTGLSWPHERPRGFAELLREGSAVLSGIVVTSLPMVGYLAAVGILDDMIQNMIAISRIYNDSPTGIFPDLWPLNAQIDSVRSSPGLVMPGMLVNGLRGLASHHGYQYLTAYTGLVDSFLRLAYYLPVLLYLGTAGLLLYRLVKRTWSRDDEAALLCLITAVALYLTIFSFPAFHYMTPTLPPLVALSVFLAFRIQDAFVGLRRRAVVAVHVLAVFLYLTASSAALATYMTVPRRPVVTERGTIWVEEMTASLWTEIISYTRSRVAPQDGIYVVPYFPLFYFLTDRDHPSRFVALGPGLPGRAVENEIIAELESKQVDSVLYTPGQEYPGLESFKNAYPRLHGHIRRRFDVERRFLTTFGLYAEFLRRKPDGKSVSRKTEDAIHTAERGSTRFEDSLLLR